MKGEGRVTGESVVDLSAFTDEVIWHPDQDPEAELTHRLAAIVSEARIGEGQPELIAQLIALMALGQRQADVIAVILRFMSSHKGQGVWSSARLRSETEAEVKNALDDVAAAAKAAVTLVAAIKVLLAL